MAGRTGLFAARDASNNGTTPVGARLALGGLLAGNGASPLDVRAGVLADSGGAIVSGAANMSYNVRAFRAVSLASAANGPVIAANDATVNVVTTAAPGSNSRYDLIWARQHLVTGDGHSDSDVIYEIGVTQGTVAASPTIPAAPAGAIGLTAALVTAGVTATSGLTYTRVHAWTVANGGVIPIYTLTERNAISPYAGMVIWYVPDLRMQVYDGTTWKPVGSGLSNPIAILTKTANQSITNGSYVDVTWSTAPDNSPGTGHFTISSTTVTVLKAGLYRVKAECMFETGGTGNRFVRLMKNGVEVLTNRLTISTSNLPVSVDRTLLLAANDVLKIMSQVTGGAAANMTGSAVAPLYQTAFEVEYLGVPAT